MKVLVVAAWLSADGSYGGPVSVALDHAAAITDAGHRVTLAAGWDGVVAIDTAAHTKLFRGWRPRSSSFAGLVVPGLLGWVARNAAGFDVAHVHLTRDLVTLPAAALARARGVPLVVQTHGQVRPERSGLQAVLDVALARRTLRGAAAVVALTSREEQDLSVQGVAVERLVRMDNGVPLAARLADWSTEAPLVLYSSRFANRKRPVAFVAAAAEVHRVRPDVRFEMWGPDGGELAAVRAETTRLGLDGVVRHRGAAGPAEARANLERAQVFVLPSRAEPFPMALLEAFSAGLPAVITTETGVSAAARAAGAAEVTDGSPVQLAAGVLRLIGDEGVWRGTAAAARGLAEERFAMAAVAKRLVEVYSDAIDSRPR